jgi:uncharacterized membrane protein YfcA
VDVTVQTYALLWLAALMGGALNAVAGGGTFFTFPSLALGGLPSLEANATSNVALWPGGVSSALGYRGRFARRGPVFVRMCVASALGGAAGSVLLILTPQRVFTAVIPGLMLLASVVFTLGGRLVVKRTGDEGEDHPALPWVQGLISVYGGYFGGGQGILMLAGYSALGMVDVHRMNAFKSVMAALANGVGVVVFAVAGRVVWAPALVMLTGGVLGGYVGARLAQRVSAARVRWVVVAVAWGTTAHFVWQGWLS